MDDSLEQKQAFTLHEMPTNNPGTASSADVQHVLSPGTLIDNRFRVIGEIGRGGAGIVYQVEQILLKQEFAMKVLSPVGVNEETWRRFQKEAQSAGRLDHAGFVKVHDFGLIDGSIPYFTMDLVRGETLTQLIRRVGPLPWRDAIPLFLQLCFALDYAHDHGIVHRDLKPSNMAIFTDDISGNTSVKIFDFGIAKLIDADTVNLTQTGAVFGTPFYMSPEQCVGHAVDQRSDIYSLGCVFFEALTGVPPFATENALALMMQHQNEDAPSLKEGSMGGTFPLALENLIRKMMAKKPSDRYQKLAATANDLLDVQQGRVLAFGSTKNSNTSQLQTTPKKAVAVQIYIALALTVVGSLLVFLAFKAAVVSEDKSAPKIVPDFHSINQGQKTIAEEVADRKYFSDITKGPNGVQIRRFIFPTMVSIGKINYRVGNKVEHREARGTDLQILVLPGKPVLNIESVNWAVLGSYPQYLSKFQPDEVGSLNLGTKSFGRQLVQDERLFDSELFYIGNWKSLYSIVALPKDVSDRGIEQLANLPPLLFFNVSETQATGRGLNKMINLHKVSNLHVDGLKDINVILPRFRNSDKLRVLHASHTGLQDQDLKNLAGVKSLKQLNIRGNPGITDRGLSYIQNLRMARLALDGCSITPKSIETLAKMHVAVRLSLDTSKWSKADVDRLKTSVPCEITCLANEIAKANQQAKENELAEEIEANSEHTFNER